MKFELPLGLQLEIKRFPTAEEYIDFDSTREEPGVCWNIFCEERPLPWHAKTRLHAYSIAMSYQLSKLQNETD